MKKLAQKFQSEWDHWYANSPITYRFAELDDSHIIALTVRYGQNVPIAEIDSVEVDAQTWERTTDYSLVWRMSFACAAEYT